MPYHYGRVGAKTETKHFTVMERDLSYRFYLHQHPYVQQLVQLLIRKSTAGLQAADTDYALDGASLPGSLELATVADTNVTIPGGTRIAMLAKVMGTAGGSPLELAADMEVKAAGATLVQVKASDGMTATLVNGMTKTPPDGAVLTLTQNSNASLSGNTKVTLKANTDIKLHDGTPANIPAGTAVLLPDGSALTIPNGTQMKLLKSRPLPTLYADFFAGRYKPNAALVKRPYPVKDLDFTSSGAYAVYNWELFFHVPMMLAIHLSKNQQFADAQRWFHYLFDPTDDSEGPTPERFWKVRPFQSTDVRKIGEILTNLVTGADDTLRLDTINSIHEWERNPFRPHVIARYRQQAYMYKTVMAYLDNLIAWGDSLFRQDTGEAIDEALMLYVLAANILGPRPQAVPQKGTVRPQTYSNLRQDLKAFGTALRDMEPDLPFDLMPDPGAAGGGDRMRTLRSLGQALYFCVPRNDRLLGYWDTVADRLFKIRNSLNFQGVFRQLALFAPPIDPALLAQAAAAGLDVAAIVNGLNQPLPLVRFGFLVQKAGEIVQEVKALGTSLLTAMEKEDGEALGILRAKHERVILGMTEQVRYMHLQEAIKAQEGLQKSLALAVQRYTHYEKQLGRKPEDINQAIQQAVQALGEVDRDSLAKQNFSAAEPELALREITPNIATDALAQAAQDLAGGKLLSSYEVLETIALEGAQIASDIAGMLSVASSIASIVPQFEVSAEPWGMGGATSFGGQNVASGITAGAGTARAIADRLNFEGRRAARIDGFARRGMEWAFQSNLAAGDINQIFKQLRAAQIRVAIAEQELKNHRQQMKNAEEIERFLNEEGAEKTGKKTNKALYTWMKREVKGLYSQCFQFAFDVARKAERALQHELGNPDLGYLQFGYLAGKEGLLAGEKLYLDVKRMEIAYHELNQREYELTKHVSLLQVDPLALVQLRATGRCTVTLPESLFDMDGPGHYFRRIKTVAVSIPSVTGPNAGVNCTLTLLKSSIRTTPVLSDGVYARDVTGDDRFSDYFGSLQSIVTSSANMDSGLFETNLRDERYLPFEHSGVISEWQLELPANPGNKDPRQFDYDTISDVILHIRYTARQGGDLLRKGATDNLKDLIKTASAAGSVRLFSTRHEFPTEWAKFQSEAADANGHYPLALTLLREHYPFWSQDRLKNVERVEILAQSREKAVPASLDLFDGMNTKIGTLAKRWGQVLGGPLTGGVPATPDGALTLCFGNRALADVWVAVKWSGESV